MAPFLAFMTLVCLWLPVHLYLSRADLPELREWVAWVKEEVDEVRKSRVEEELMKVRQNNYKLFSRCCAHLGFVTGCLLWHQAFQAPSFQTITWATICVVGYVQHVMVNVSMELTPARLKFLTYLLHVKLLILIVSTAWAASIFQFVVLQVLQTSVRFLVALAFLDLWVSIPFQMLFAMVECFIYLSAFGESNVYWVPLWCAQFFILVSNVSCSLFMDLALRGRIDALFETADAESLLSSFRRLLRGVCDGEVLLDSRMAVTQESDCLKHLIFTDVSLVGRSFEQLLAGEERPRFKNFIKSSSQAFSIPESEHLAPPCCSRVSFCGSAGLRVAADIYHVPVPRLFGANEPYHLIAFNEDVESRPQPEAEEGAVPPELLQTGRPGFA